MTVFFFLLIRPSEEKLTKNLGKILEDGRCKWHFMKDLISLSKCFVHMQ